MHISLSENSTTKLFIDYETFIIIRCGSISSGVFNQQLQRIQQVWSHRDRQKRRSQGYTC